MAWRFLLCGLLAAAATTSAAAQAPALPDEKAQVLRQIEYYGAAYAYQRKCRVRPMYEVTAISAMAQGMDAAALTDEEAFAAWDKGRKSVENVACDHQVARDNTARVARFAFLAVTARPAKEMVCRWEGDGTVLEMRRRDAAAGLQPAEIENARKTGAGIKPPTEKPGCFHLLQAGMSRDIASVYVTAGEAYPNRGSAFGPPRALGP